MKKLETGNIGTRHSLRLACSLPHGSRTPARISPDELQRGVAVGDVNQGCGYGNIGNWQHFPLPCSHFRIFRGLKNPPPLTMKNL